MGFPALWAQTLLQTIQTLQKYIEMVYKSSRCRNKQTNEFLFVIKPLKPKKKSSNVFKNTQLSFQLFWLNLNFQTNFGFLI